MRTKKRVDELEFDLAQAVGRISKLEWYVEQLLPTKPKRKYVKSGKYTKEAKFVKSMTKLMRKRIVAAGGKVFVGGTPHRKPHSRTWTDAERKAQSDRMHKYWAERKETK